MEDYLEQSNAIMGHAIEEHQPYAVVLAFSGGGDSMAAYQVAKQLGVKLDGIMHVNTRAGIEETTQFVRQFTAEEQLPYFEADAGDTYERRMLANGFTGRGNEAHAKIYRVLKATHLRTLISKQFRHGIRGRRVLLLNGVRKSESSNRAINYGNSYTNADPAATSNIWVNLIWDYGDAEKQAAVQGAPVNPVIPLLHRSAECLCGATQSQEDRRMASFFFPAFGKRLDGLERRVKCNYPWGWGEDVPRWWTQVKRGQMTLGDEFMPMCNSCQLSNPDHVTR